MNEAMLWISEILNGFGSLLARLGATVTFTLGLLLLIGAPLLALMILPSQSKGFLSRFLAVLVCTFCAAFGGMFLSNAMKTFEENSAAIGKTEKLARENERQKGELVARTHELGEAQEKNLRLELEKARLQSEKERLERMRISIDSAAPILKLGLLNVHMTTYDFLHLPVDPAKTTEEGIYPFKEVVTRTSDYAGLQRVTMEVNLGIDLKQVKIAEHNGVLHVSGVKSESHGISNRNTVWLMKEIRKKRSVEGKPDDYRIDANDPRITDMVLQQERGLESRLNQGIEFAEHDRSIRRIAEGYLRLLLSPIGKRIEFQSPERESGDLLPLEQFIERHNAEIGKRQDGIRQQELRIDQTDKAEKTDARTMKINKSGR
jgi:hypothetical protein